MASKLQLYMFVAFWLVLFEKEICEAGTLVELSNGKIEGSVYRTPRKNVEYWAFLGIPYAAPPVGKFRFKPPQPVENWKGVLKASSNRKICYQTGIEHAHSSEDCLYLSVYTPQEPGKEASLPVMLNIHGGTFRRGSATVGYTCPQFVLEQNVVVVTINYRLGPFGFLSTGDSVIPGNMGLKDQQFALKWVQTNIHLFGGDPTKVTVMGQSAGSASVTYQILSPGSAGLFRAAIDQSGSALNTWAHDRQAVDTAYGIAAMIDPKFDRNRTTEELLDFLLGVDGKAIHATGTKYSTFAPVIEIEHDEAFLTKSMYSLVEKGQINKVPYLAGIASEEGIIAASNMKSWRKTAASYDKNLELLVDGDMYIRDDQVLSTVGLEIKKIYTNESLEQELGKFTQYHGDNRYMRAPIRYAELQSIYTDVWFYQFSYVGKMGGNKVKVEGIDGVGHGEDLYYFWAYYGNYSIFPESDMRALDDYVGLLTNFAKYLNPTPEKFRNVIWPKVTKNNFYYLDINKNLTVKENPREFSYKKWVDIYDVYATKPIISF
uniref:Carboxylic ester hydrolase n=1 Tax=Leptinotarsa decemlineata TaxID=7539 RepID=A0A0A7EQM2_LEPDE|nr:esterase [Leptinotarsa decemlineata]